MSRSLVFVGMACLANNACFPASLAATGGHVTQLWPIRCKHGQPLLGKLYFPVPGASLPLVTFLFHLPTWRGNSHFTTRDKFNSLFGNRAFWQLA